ncbi:MAG: sigma-70 family RNA polymerase sigma factor [Actinomycetota bacterium]
MTESENKQIEQYRGYLQAVARLQLSARPWLAGKLDSSDLVQKTFVRAYEHCEQYRGGSDAELAGWLRQILNRVLANELRHWGQARRDVGAEQSLEQELDASGYRLDQMLQADQTSASQRAQRGERAERLAEAIEDLPEEQRVVVLARHCRGLGLQEIAEETGRTAASVAGLLRRGLATLREQLGEELS